MPATCLNVCLVTSPLQAVGSVTQTHSYRCSITLASVIAKLFAMTLEPGVALTHATGLGPSHHHYHGMCPAEHILEEPPAAVPHLNAQVDAEGD